MKTVLIILMFVAAFVAFYEQSKPHPNAIIMVLALIVFVGILMWLMNKVPSRNKENDRNDEV